MEVQFKTTKLEKEYKDSRKAAAAYGLQVGRRYIERINLIKSARDLEEVQKLPGLRCHELTGNRHGQWAINLTGQSRLIFTLAGQRMEIALVEEVSKHYGD